MHNQERTDSTFFIDAHNSPSFLTSYKNLVRAPMALPY